jgi:hypothetical protein
MPISTSTPRLSRIRPTPTAAHPLQRPSHRDHTHKSSWAEAAPTHLYQPVPSCLRPQRTAPESMSRRGIGRRFWREARRGMKRTWVGRTAHFLTLTRLRTWRCHCLRPGTTGAIPSLDPRSQNPDHPSPTTSSHSIKFTARSPIRYAWRTNSRRCRETSTGRIEVIVSADCNAFPYCHQSVR